MYLRLDSDSSDYVIKEHEIGSIVKAASHASRVLFIKDGEVFHQIYRGDNTNEQ